MGFFDRSKAAEPTSRKTTQPPSRGAPFAAELPSCRAAEGFVGSKVTIFSRDNRVTWGHVGQVCHMCQPGVPCVPARGPRCASQVCQVCQPGVPGASATRVQYCTSQVCQPGVPARWAGQVGQVCQLFPTVQYRNSSLCGSSLALLRLGIKLVCVVRWPQMAVARGHLFLLTA